MHENETCAGCGAEVESDGYGELVHSETLKYGCRPGVRSRALDSGPYPVAH